MLLHCLQQKIAQSKNILFFVDLSALTDMADENKAKDFDGKEADKLHEDGKFDDLYIYLEKAYKVTLSFSAILFLPRSLLSG